MIQIRVNKPEDIDAALNKYNFKHIQFIETCKICGKEIIFQQIHKPRINRYKAFMCRTCYLKYLNSNRSEEDEKKRVAKILKTKENWPEEKRKEVSNKIVESWKHRDVNKMMSSTKQTKLKNHGDPNYNNIKQGVITNKQNHDGIYSLNLPETRSKANTTFKKNHNGMTFGEYYASDIGRQENSKRMLSRSDDEKKRMSAKSDKTFRANHGGKSESEYKSSKEYRDECIRRNCIKYGTDFPQQHDSIRNKIKNTHANRTPEQKRAAADLAKKTSLEKTGYSHHMYDPKHVAHLKTVWENKSKDELKQFSDQMRDIQNNRTPEQKRKSNELRENTSLKKYGVKHFVNFKKIEETSLKRYGVKYFIGSDLWKQKMLDEYGAIYVSHKYMYYGITFDSTWELAVWIYCIDHNIPIMRNPCKLIYQDANNKNRIYEPDFMIGDKLIELKGKHFWNPDGTMCYPYNKLHHDANKFTPEEKAFMDDLYERKHQCGLANGVEFWKESDCKPYIEYCDNYYPGWRFQFRRDNPLNPSYWCSNILNLGYYQRQDFIPLVQSATPYAKPDADGYVFSDTEMVTPFDIK